MLDGVRRSWLAVPVLALAMAGAACGGGDGAVALDAPRSDGPTDASLDGLGGPGIAPPATHPGEVVVPDGDRAVHLGLTPLVIRVDAAADDHVGFVLSFVGPGAGIELDLQRWDGAAAQRLVTTDVGAGVRALAALDPSGPRTFWFILHGPGPIDATLSITRTTFVDADTCAADCGHLLQLPVAIDPAVDGYVHEPTTLFPYQFGRRDLIMMVRAAGRRMATAGRGPLVPRDLSQRDGQTPGTDVGAPRHASHQRGRDVDLSIYGIDDQAAWRAFCATQPAAAGLECVPGTLRNFGARATVHLYAGFLATGRTVAGFLDAELIDAMVAAAPAAAQDGLIAAALVPLLDDGVHLQHAANQYHHLHIRVSEVAP